jgi:hypothetical protein
MEDGSRGHKGAISEVELMVKTAKAVVSNPAKGCCLEDLTGNDS